MLTRLKKFVTREIGYLFFRRYVSWREVKRHYSKRYSPSAPRAGNTRKMVVFMADGFKRMSGWADRLRGMVALYGYCCDHDIDFRIHFTDPFLLQKYLQPASYNWCIRPEELCWNSDDSRAFHWLTVNNHNRQREVRYQQRIIDKGLRKDFRQAHVYTAFDCEDERFAKLFNELFRPTQIVEDALKNLPQDYISVSARFMELLGDFVEPKQARCPLPEAEQIALMDKCIAAIKKVHDGKPVLLTSDSVKFLHYVTERLDFVHIIDGDVCHISVHSDCRDAADLKTFADFYGIARAEKSYLLLGPGMYNSNFSRRAAQSAPHSFEVKTLPKTM